MSAYIVLILAVLSRILPHAFHTVSWNFTAVGGGLLFFGSRMGAGDGSRRFTGAAAARLASALAVLMATDYYLTVYAYQYPFRVQWYLATWVWYAAVCLLGMGLLNKVTVLRVAGAAVASATSFFLISNFAVWATGAMYPHSLAGLGACFVAGVPFYRNDLASTAITAGALFGLPVLAAKFVEMMHAAQPDHFA
jgi:hypothetical protein